MNAQDEQRIRRLEKWVRNFRVGGNATCKKTPEGVTISVPIPPAPQRPQVSQQLPTGEFQGQVYMMVSDNEAGWAFPTLINPLT